MKKILILFSLMLIGISANAKSSSSNAPDGNAYFRKKVAIISTGRQFDYDEGKQKLTPSGDQAKQIASVGRDMLSSELKMYGANVVNSYTLQQTISGMNGNEDFSKIQRIAKSEGIDYVFIDDLNWLMYQDLLFIFEYHIKSLQVATGIIDRSSCIFTINGLKDNQDMAQKRMTKGHNDAIKEVVSRYTPRLYGVTDVSKNGKNAKMLALTFAGYDSNDVFYAYKAGGESRFLDGKDHVFFTFSPLASSTSFKVDDPVYKVSFNNKIEVDPKLIVSTCNLMTSAFPGIEFAKTPISVKGLTDANNVSYAGHNKNLVNYALFNAVHKNAMLQVLVNEATAKYTCVLSNYSEKKNIVRFNLTITDNALGTSVKNVDIESHTSNLDSVIAAHINEVFGVPVALGNVDKKTISFYLASQIAYAESDQFILAVKDAEGNETRAAIYDLNQWKGQEYVLKVSSVLDKKAYGKVGKDASVTYKLYRYVESPAKPTKDNSEIHKVAAASILMPSAK